MERALEISHPFDSSPARRAAVALAVVRVLAVVVILASDALIAPATYYLVRWLES